MRTTPIAVLALGLAAGALSLPAPARAQACGYATELYGPAAATCPATEVSDTGALLAGQVDPGGSATTYAFQVAETADFASPARFPPEPADAGDGTEPVDVFLTASGLKPGTRYFVRLLASNSAGNDLGATVAFTTTTTGKTTPGVVTGPAPVLRDTAATITGSIDPVGVEASYAFAYGPTLAYGSTSAAGTVAPRMGPADVSADLQDLEPGTVYHYRLVAVNPQRVAGVGVDRTFETPSVEDPDAPDRVAPSWVGLHVTPSHDRWLPYAFTARGRLRPPPSVSPKSCSGKVRIFVTQEGEELLRRGTEVRSNCRFSRRIGVEPAGLRGRLKVFARFRGSSELTPRDSRRRTVWFG